MSSHIKVFTKIYENKVWGDNMNNNYSGSSGGGSDVEYNIETYIPFLKNIIKEKDIKSVVDLGCGDFRCGPCIYEDLNNIIYYGYDAYEKVIVNNRNKFSPPKYYFIHSDFYSEKELIQSAELCILKDVLQHWSLEKIYNFLDYIVSSKKFKYILIINCCKQIKDDVNINDGDATPLSCDYFPLKKYNPVKLYNYHTKEVSIIDLNKE